MPNCTILPPDAWIGTWTPRIPDPVSGGSFTLRRLEGLASDYGNLGVIYELRDDLEQARRLWTKARELFESIGMEPKVKRMDDWLNGLEDEK